MVEQQFNVWFLRSLGSWHRHVNKRIMPWKGIRDPDKIWLSEIILQQTRVEQGLGYYERFTARYPRVQDLAQATDNEVFKLWEGLGYYNRCRNLLATARAVSDQHKGRFPSTREGLLALKGIGSYTAAAIGSFAFDLPLAVVDGNVLRVLSRLFAVEDPIDQKAGRAKLEFLAEQLLDKKDPASYNQAIMDLGATVCKPRQPICEACPLVRKCIAYASGSQHAYPIKSKKAIQQQRFFYYLILEAKGKKAVRQRTGKDIWSGLHEFILKETDEPVTEKELQSLTFWGVEAPITRSGSWMLSETIVHQLTHQKIHGRFLHAQITTVVPIDGYAWVSDGQMIKMAFPRLISRYLNTD